MAELFNIMKNPKAGFDAALAALRSGGLAAVPTETVYGLGADATNGSAVSRIFAAKGRPDFNPLIAHVSGVEMARSIAVLNDVSLKLASRFWPGPLTLVVPLKPGATIAPAVTAGLETIALRQPKGIMADLANALGNPIAAPSANSSGRISPTLAKHVMDDLGDKIDVILDGGNCDVGLESTIVKADDDGVALLRKGGIAVETLEMFLGQKLRPGTDKPKVEAPGMLLAHYAPRTPVRLNAPCANEGEVLLAFGPGVDDGPAVRNLSPEGDLHQAAHNLFAMMKELDMCGATRIAVQPIPQQGIGAAINDRLERAAASVERRA